MVSTPLSTLSSASLSLASYIRRGQGEASKLQAEVASGRLYDVGKSLGYETQALVSFRSRIEIIQRTADVNDQVSARLDVSQGAFGSITDNANNFLSALVAARNDPRSSPLVSQQAEMSFKSFIEAANANFAGVYVFSGIETTEPAFADYFADPAPASRAAMEAAFIAEFGFSNTDPAVASITVSSMQAFMDNAFTMLFSDPDWGANWSPATAETLTSVVSEDREISTSVSAASEAFRVMTSAYVLVSSAGTQGLNEAAFGAVLDKAIGLVGRGIGMMAELQGVLGIAQQTVKETTEAMNVRSNILGSYVGKAEGVDLSEVSVRLNALLNQLEATYAVTGRLQNLSLLDAI